MAHFEVHDDRRILKFEGEEIGFSSSEKPGSGRWIEFTLYKTAGDGQYVLSRVGVSNVYHTPECRVAKGRIEPAPWGALGPDAVPCYRVPGATGGCRPDPSEFPMVCPEEDRTWARAYRTTAALMDALMKEDEDGNHYMTAVARRLVQEAAARDPELVGAYQVETIT